ncbi:hypothetical protein ACFOGI_15330 [Virgibacillus xinjiangensis]|uniref:Uncharacterized protein n=1 Tax=Virgibacillus xinjiangensis TaxID=393090 RepID=A0ABV7CZ89_9BACI
MDERGECHLGIPIKVRLNRFWINRLIKKVNRMETLDIHQTYRLMLLRTDLLQKGNPYIENCRKSLNKWWEKRRIGQISPYRYAWKRSSYWKLAPFILLICFLVGITLSVKGMGVLPSFGLINLIANLAAAFSWTVIFMIVLGIYNIWRINYNRKQMEKERITKQQELIQHMRKAMETINKKLNDSIVPRELLTLPVLKQMMAMMEWEDIKGKKTQMEIISWYRRKEGKKKARQAKKEIGN